MNPHLRNGLTLALLACAAAVLLALVHSALQPQLMAREREARAQALLAMLPPGDYDRDVTDKGLCSQDLAELGLSAPAWLHTVRRAGRPVAAILPTTAREGYAGAIDLRVAVHSDCSVAAVRIVAQQETPGIGARDADEERSWLDGFSGRSLNNPAAAAWRVRRDGGEFDQLTGATITARAVTDTVARALRYCERNRALLFPTAGG